MRKVRFRQPFSGGVSGGVIRDLGAQVLASATFGVNLQSVSLSRLP